MANTLTIESLQSRVADIDFSVIGRVHTTVLKLTNGVEMHIFIQSNRIYVTTLSYKELTDQLEENEDSVDACEIYDTTDAAYFLESPFAEAICCALLDLSHRCL